MHCKWQLICVGSLLGAVFALGLILRTQTGPADPLAFLMASRPSESIMSPAASSTPSASAYPAESTSLPSLLRVCTVGEGGRPRTRPLPILPPSVLTFSPSWPNWPSWHPGPCVVRSEQPLPGTPPVFSIQVVVWNRDKQIRTVLVQLLKLTREPWELLVIVDGANDESLRVVNEAIDEYLLGWPACEGVRAADLMTSANQNWPSGSQAPVGNIGAACTLVGAPPASLVRIAVIHVPTVGLYATIANNIHMRVAAAAPSPPEYHIFVDDDQFMTVPGWNTWLAQPARTFSDVVSVSMRCTFTWPWGEDAVGLGCGSNTPNFRIDEGAPPGNWTFTVRNNAIRGPLLLRARMATELGFLDELRHMGVHTHGCDLDFNRRAWGDGKTAEGARRWVSGFLPVPFAEERCCRNDHSDETNRASLMVQQWFEARRATVPKLACMPTRSRRQARADEHGCGKPACARACLRVKRAVCGLRDSLREPPSRVSLPHCCSFQPARAYLRVEPTCASSLPARRAYLRNEPTCASSLPAPAR